MTSLLTSPREGSFPSSPGKAEKLRLGGERAVVEAGDLEPISLPGWEYLARERVAGTKGLPCE